MVLGPKHVGAFLMFQCVKFYKFYTCAAVVVIIESLRQYLSNIPGKHEINLLAPELFFFNFSTSCIKKCE